MSDGNGVVSGDGRCDVVGVVSDDWSMLVSGLTVSDFEQECLAALARVPRSLQQSLHRHKPLCVWRLDAYVLWYDV